MNETDELLLEQLHQGDNAAFETLFLRHYERIYRLLFNLVGDEDAEDLVQETFLALYNQPPHPGVGNGLVSWLCRVALNRGYNTLRSRRRAHEHSVQVETPQAPGDPYYDVVRAEERAQVRSILAQLPERQRNLLLLRYAGFSYAEIATTLGIAPGSVGTLLVRAERACAAAFQDTVSYQHNGR